MANKKWKKKKMALSKQNNRPHRPTTLYGTEVIRDPEEIARIHANQIKGVSWSFIQSAGSCQSGYLRWEDGVKVDGYGNEILKN